MYCFQAYLLACLKCQQKSLHFNFVEITRLFDGWESENKAKRDLMSKS